MTKPSDKPPVANDPPAFKLEITKSCGNCDAFSPFPNKNGEGKCTRHPPVVLIVGMQANPVTREPMPLVQGFFPPTNAAGFCHDWIQPAGGAAMPVDFATIGKPQ